MGLAGQAFKSRVSKLSLKGRHALSPVITSYSIHYTKLYEATAFNKKYKGKPNYKNSISFYENIFLIIISLKGTNKKENYPKIIAPRNNFV